MDNEAIKVSPKPETSLPPTGEKPFIDQKTITPNEFAERFHYAKQTVRQLIREGKLKALKIGVRKWAIPESELSRFAKEYHPDLTKAKEPRVKGTTQFKKQSSKQAAPEDVPEKAKASPSKGEEIKTQGRPFYEIGGLG
uniref:Putative DNA binding, helix-turn-helix domain containing protein n=1 Tax=viral metagenome TaxID=1070528 RepID=A0A6H2A0F1_9ZZZZ